MNPVEAEARVNRLLATFRGRMGIAVRQTWAEALADLEPAAVDGAIDHLARTEQRMPSLALVVQAALRHTTPAAGSGVTWQVLATWTDQAGLAYAEPRRWHTDEQAALDDYQAACVVAATRTAGTVELLRYEPGRPVQTVERTG